MSRNQRSRNVIWCTEMAPLPCSKAGVNSEEVIAREIPRSLVFRGCRWFTGEILIPEKNSGILYQVINRLATGKQCEQVAN